MADSALEARVYDEGGVSVVELRGRIDGPARPVLDRAYADARASGGHEIVFDLARVDFINSTGVSILVKLVARAREDGARLHACGLTDYYREVFQITGLDPRIAVHPDLASAIAAARSA